MLQNIKFQQRSRNGCLQLFFKADIYILSIFTHYALFRYAIRKFPELNRKILQFKMSLIDTIQSYSEQPLNKQLLLNILKEYKRPYDKIGELVKQHILIQIKKGLYIPGKNLKVQGPERFLIANHLHGPSYVSSDSALSHWGFIPERE